MKMRIVPAVAILGIVAVSCGGSDARPEVGSTVDPAPVTTTVIADSDTSVAELPTTIAEPIPPPAPAAAKALPADTGPELEWVEVAAGLAVTPGELVWTGSSFIIASHDEAGAVFLQSVDGIDWQPLADLPGDADLFGIHAAGESIVVWGVYPTAPDPTGPDEPAGVPDEVPALPPEDVVLLMSTDGGQSWTEFDSLAFPTRQSTSSYVHEFQGFGAAAISGDIVIVVVETVIRLDDQRILADNGFDPDAYSLEYDFGDGEVSVCLFPRVVTDEPGGPCVDDLTLGFDQLELTDDDVAAFTTSSFPFKIYRSVEGGPFEAADADAPDDGGVWYPGWMRVVNGEFVGSTTNEAGLSIIARSADGLEWELGTPSRTHLESVTADGATLYGMEWSGSRASVVRSDDAGRSWTELDVGSESVYAAFGGPSGLAVTGQNEDGSATDEPGSIVIDKDGYVVTFAEDGLTVVDTATGETVLAFGPEQMQAPEPPETVIQEPDGGALTFLDPDTLEPLLTLTESDWEEAASSAFVMPEFFIGWSADGEHWGWQTAAEAFGANGGVQLAVGDTAVVAMYQAFDTSEPSRVRIFTAAVG